MKKKLIRITTVPLSLDKLLGKQLSFMNQHFEVTAVAADEPYLKRVAEKYGVKQYHVEMTRTIAPVADLKAVWKLYRFLKKEKPAIVHSHTPKAGIVGMMAAYFAGIPVRMHTVAGLPLMEAHGLKRKLLNIVETFTYLFATKVYPNSKGLYDFILREKFCSGKKLKVIGNGSSNGIDTAHFCPSQISEEQKIQLKKELAIRENDFVFIFVGRLVGDKGINELITAFRSLLLWSEVGNETKLLLVGPLESELDPLHPDTLKEIETNPNIISVGYQHDVRPYFAISDCLVFPSYREGFPNVVMQAGAMGLPSIVTDINGCNEIIENNINGILIQPKNTESILHAMEQILSNADLQFSLQKNARISIVSRFEQHTLWQSLLDEYSGLNS